MSRRTILRTVIGIAISGVAIWILAGSVDLPRAFDVLRTANPAWILLMVGTVFLDVGARGARWQALLRPIKHRPVPPGARLHVPGLPREQRPAGAARRAGPEPRAGRGRGHQPRDGAGHGRRRAHRRHRHRRRVGRPRGRGPRRRRHDVDRGGPGRRVRRPARRRSDRRDRQPPAPRRRPRHGGRRAVPADPRAGAGVSATGWPWRPGRACSVERCSSARRPGPPRSPRSSPARRRSAST